MKTLYNGTQVDVSTPTKIVAGKGLVVLTPTEIRRVKDKEAKYKADEKKRQLLSVLNKRKELYGSIEEQLEFITENGLAAWQIRVAEIKADNPKPAGV